MRKSLIWILFGILLFGFSFALLTSDSAIPVNTALTIDAKIVNDIKTNTGVSAINLKVSDLTCTSLICKSEVKQEGIIDETLMIPSKYCSNYSYKEKIVNGTLIKRIVGCNVYTDFTPAELQVKMNAKIEKRLKDLQNTFNSSQKVTAITGGTVAVNARKP